MLVLVSFIQFWFDTKATVARVIISLGTLLVMAMAIAGFNRTLPPTQYTKSVDWYTGICLTFAFAALLEFVTVDYIGRTGWPNMNLRPNNANPESEQENNAPDAKTDIAADTVSWVQSTPDSCGKQSNSILIEDFSILGH